MAIIKGGMPAEKRKIDLSGPEGNAHFLIGLAVNTAKQLQWTSEEITKLIECMKSDSYDKLIQVFDDHFGHIYDLYLP